MNWEVRLWDCETYNAQGAVQVDEAEVDFVTGDLTPVV